MALSPLALIPPGCNPQCARNIISKPNLFAYASTQGIQLYTTEVKNVPSVQPPPPQDVSQPQPMPPASVAVSTFSLSSTYGAGVNNTITSFDFNDEFMAALTPKNKAVYIWRLADAESMTAKLIPSSMSAVFRNEGSPSAMCMAGKYHVLIGTKAGRMVSLNLNQGNEPRCVAIPGPATARARAPSYELHNANNSNSAAITSDPSHVVESVECVSVAPSRPDTVACGTSDGTVAVFNLSAARGLTPTASLCPFPAHPEGTGRSGGKNSTASTPLKGASQYNAYDDDTTSSNAILKASAAPVTCMAFDPANPQYLAVGSTEGRLALIDTTSGAVVQLFDVEGSAAVSSITWIPGEAGAFYTTSTANNRVLKWSTNSKTAVGVVSLVVESGAAADGAADAREDGGDDAINNNNNGAGGGGSGGAGAGGESRRCVGLRCISAMDKDRIVVSLTNGGVKVFSTASMRTEFDLPVGHTDVLLHCKIARHDRNVAATCGVDGTIRIWDLRKLRVTTVIEVGQVMVYSIDWSKNGKQIAASLGNGEIVMYAVATQRVVWRVSAFSEMVYRVTWSVADSNVLAATSRTGLVILSAKDGMILRRYDTPRNGAFFGVDIEPHRGRYVAVGSHDHRIYVYSLSSNADTPALVLSGHTDVVSDVVFNPAAPNFLLSGSYDSTARVWDLSSNDAHTISVSARTLKGHAERVRTVAWCSIAPYLAFSASVDATMRLWDVRNGLSVASVRGHNADICALSSHPERPLVLVSAAKDGVIIFWQLALLRQVCLDASLGLLEQNLVPDASSLLTATSAPRGVSAITGDAVTKLAQELRGCTKPTERMQLLANFFEFPCGTADLADLAGFAADPQSYAADCKGLVLPASKLVEAHQARVKKMVDKAHGKSVNAAGAAYRRKKLLEAAEETLRLGQLEEYCRLLMEAEEWDRAIAMAPALSRDYWRAVCLRAAETMEAAGDPRAATYYIIAEESARAARVLARESTSRLEAAVVVARTCPQRVADSQPTSEPSHQTTLDANGQSATVMEMAQESISVLAQYDNPRLLAAVHVANGQNDAAVRVLQRSADIGLAHVLLHTVPLREQTSIDETYRQSAIMSARQHNWETALLCATRVSNPYDLFAALISYFQYTQTKQMRSVNASAGSMTSQSMSSFHAINDKLQKFYETVQQECAKLQLPLDAAEIQRRHASDGMASQNQLAAMVLQSDPQAGPVTAGTTLQTITGFLENLLTAAAPDLDGPNAQFYLKQAYNISAYVSLPLVPAPSNKPVAPGQAPPPRGVEAMQPEHRRFLSLSYIIALLYCVKVYRFPSMLNYAFAKARECAQGDAQMEQLLAQVQGSVGSYSPHSVEVDCTVMGSAVPALGADGRRVPSALSGTSIAGTVHVLEDGTFISKREALEWSMCCHFSPVGTGARLAVY